MKRHRITLLIALCFVMLFGQESMAQTAMERLKTEYPAVMEQYGKRLEAQKADYIIAIDVSGTMMQYRELVLPALYNFIDALPEDDYLAIIKFGTIAQEYGLSGKVNEGTRDDFKRTLSTIYQRDPQFVSSTDLGAMCDAILAQMSRSGGNDLKYVFMFTDFIHETGAASKWQSMQDRVAALSKTNIVRSFAMQLPGSGSGRDIQLVRNVFPNLQTIDVNNPSRLNEWFEGQKADISKERLKDLIRGDIDQWYSEDKIKTDLAIGFDRGLRFKYNVDEEVVPAFVNGVVINTCELTNKSNNVENVVFAIDSAYKGRTIKEKIGKLKFFNKALFQKDVSVTMAVTYRPMFVIAEKEGDPSFANEIRNLGLENDLMRTEELTAEKAFVIGWNIWLFSLCCGLLVAWLFLFVMNTLRRHRLGYLNLLIRDDNGNVQTHQLLNKRVVTIGANQCDINVPTIASTLVLKGRVGSPFSLVKRRVMANCKCTPTSTDHISIGGKLKKNNKFHRLKLQQTASISSLGVLNFSVGERDARKSNLTYVIACVLFVLVTLATVAVCLFL